jgi:hypothetical protein
MKEDGCMNIPLFFPVLGFKQSDILLCNRKITR